MFKTVSPVYAALNRVISSRKQLHSSRSFSNLLTAMASENEFICIDAFCARQFTKSEDPAASFIDCEPEKFLAKCIEYINAEKAAGREVLVDGYAPFCKHIFVPNFTSTKPCYIECEYLILL